MHNSDQPLSFYAASKKTNEVIAHSYANIYNLKCTGLRFFTVYGELGRPDMALFKFVDRIFNNKTISLFNRGDHMRDFTFIDDVVDAMIKLKNNKSKNKIPYSIINIGGNNPKSLKYFLNTISANIGITPKIKLFQKQRGDVKITHADNKKLISNRKIQKNTIASWY